MTDTKYRQPKNRVAKAATAMACIAMLTLVSACGDTQGQRALSGGAIGAGVGTIGGALISSNPVAGALVGGIAGAGIGAATNKSQINFGDIK